MRPLFSCVVPVKGRRPYWNEALESLRRQDMGEDLEIIVQDGDVEPDRGQSDALNKGFAKARGAWFFWLNADDLLLPHALQKVKKAMDGRGMETPGDVQWIVGNEVFVDGAGKRTGASVGCGWHDWLFRHAVPHVNGPSAFFRRELFERVGGFDASLDYCMDWDLWIRFKKAGARYVRIPEFLWAFRLWEGSKTQGRAARAESAKQQAEVQRMLAKNDFAVTRSGVWRYKLWRMLCGCYLKEAMGGRRP